MGPKGHVEHNAQKILVGNPAEERRLGTSPNLEPSQDFCGGVQGGIRARESDVIAATVSNWAERVEAPNEAGSDPVMTSNGLSDYLFLTLTETRIWK